MARHWTSSCHSSSGMPGSGTTVSVTWRRRTAPGWPPPKGVKPGEQLVQDGRQRVDVDGGARRQALDDLGRQVVRRADDLRGAGSRRGRVDQLGDAEVGEQGGVRAAGAERALHVEQDVLRLDVAVDDPGGVRGGEPVGDVRDDRDRRLGGEPALPVEPGAQVRAADQVHDEREVVAVDDEVADADHVGVVEAEQGGALLDEAADELLVGGEVLAQQLDGDGPLGPLAQPHRAGAAPPQDLVGGVPAADLPCQDCSLQRRALRAQSYAGTGAEGPGWRQPSLLRAEITRQKSTNPQSRVLARGPVSGAARRARRDPDPVVTVDDTSRRAASQKLLPCADPVLERRQLPDQPARRRTG